MLAFFVNFWRARSRLYQAAMFASNYALCSIFLSSKRPHRSPSLLVVARVGLDVVSHGDDEALVVPCWGAHSGIRLWMGLRIEDKMCFWLPTLIIQHVRDLHDTWVVLVHDFIFNMLYS